MPTTKNGYDLFELLSALQKDIRRGNEEQASLWAIELESFSARVVWNRLQIIASEDVGAATNEMAVLTEVLEQKYWRFKAKGNSGYRLFLIHAVIALSRATKTRATDELITILYPKVALGDDLPPIPDYAKDMHTKAGKISGKGVDTFYDEGALISPSIPSPYTERSRTANQKYLSWWRSGAKQDMDVQRSAEQPEKAKSGERQLSLD